MGSGLGFLILIVVTALTACGRGATTAENTETFREGQRILNRLDAVPGATRQGRDARPCSATMALLAKRCEARRDNGACTAGPPLATYLRTTPSRWATWATPRANDVATGAATTKIGFVARPASKSLQGTAN